MEVTTYIYLVVPFFGSGRKTLSGGECVIFRRKAAHLGLVYFLLGSREYAETLFGRSSKTLSGGECLILGEKQPT